MTVTPASEVAEFFERTRQGTNHKMTKRRRRYRFITPPNRFTKPEVSTNGR